MINKSDDIKLWEDFKNKLEKSKKADNGLMSETGKKFLKLVKNNIKKCDCGVDNIEVLGNDNANNFVLEKDKSLGIDKNSDKRLNQGKYKIDYKLDLHGATLQEAYNKIKNLFEKAELNNYRCLLIITGKGIHSTNKTIKSSIEDWFKEPYFSNRIIKYTDANVIHGGSGAIYVLLRNNK